ncbi:MAG: PTS sugar transporter subunit IIA, partial [Bacillota bacterium]|nr:PTS sugar transporter subunit IIA [Bacillota bacterium]
QFIKKRDLRIQRFLDSFVEQWFVPDLSLSSKEAVLRYAGELVSSAVTDAEDIYHMFTHRESISSGALGDNIAVISSTYPVLEETKVGLLILKKPVRWSDEIAQIVFVVLTGREQDSLLFIMDHLRYLLKNVNLICKLLGAKSLSEAKQLMGDCLHDTK